MGFKCGIVGLPNVGKSTLFNALTAAQVAAENYPFCTIDPHVGRVSVPDPRLYALADIVKPQKTIPTHMEFVDIAGLVAGAARGEGLGNQFLAHIREVDAIAHVVRCFINDDIIHVANRVDPLSDLDTILTELALADLESVEKAIAKVVRKAQSGDKEAQAEHAALTAVQTALASGNDPRLLTIAQEHRQRLSSTHLLCLKPIMLVANVDETTLLQPQNNPHYQNMVAWAQKNKAQIVPICAKMEMELAGFTEDERLSLLHEMGMPEPGLNRLIRAGYELLGLATYFTAGVKEVRAWTFQCGMTAPQTAGIIHTDFTRGFIRAEVIAYQDFVQYRGEAGAKEAGKWRLEGKEYIVQDGDVIYFRFNT